MSGRSVQIERRIARLERCLRIAQGPDARDTSLLALDAYHAGDTTPPEAVQRDRQLLGIWWAMIDMLKTTEHGLFGPDGYEQEKHPG